MHRPLLSASPTAVRSVCEWRRRATRLIASAAKSAEATRRKPRPHSLERMQNARGFF